MSDVLRDSDLEDSDFEPLHDCPDVLRRIAHLYHAFELALPVGYRKERELVLPLARLGQLDDEALVKTTLDSLQPRNRAF